MNYEGIIFYDVINGVDCPTSFEEMLLQVKDNPFSTGDNDEAFWFSADESISFSITEIEEILNEEEQ